MKNQSKHVIDAIKNKEYSFDPDLRLSKRVAHFLDWAAKNYPNEAVPYNYIFKAVIGCSKAPALNSKEAQTIQRLAPAFKKVLFEEFLRGFISERGIGVRASFDDADALKNVLTKKVKRFDNARKSVIETRGIIDLNAIPNNSENKLLKEWTGRSVDSIMKVIGSADFGKRLALPAATEA